MQQFFQVIYDDTTYDVDLISLINSSQKFKELIDPFINDLNQMKELHLEILCKQFSKRDIDNFLKICQKLPTDVQNSEMEDICKIAKMFKAEAIYEKGLAFIQSTLNPNFNVPDNKYDGSDGKTYLIVIGHAKSFYHDPNISELIFEEDTNSNRSISKQNQIPKNDISKLNNKPHFIIYQVVHENHKFKCPTYKFVNEDQIIYSAKQKYNEIFIAKGNNIHIHDKEKQICHILQKETTISNIITTNDQTFEVFYDKNSINFPMNVSFQFKNKTVNWSPKRPRFDPVTKKYYLNFRGKFNHEPIDSSRNTVLQDKNRNSIFIIRKTSSTIYEIECLSIFDPLVIFSIGLSGIVGPFFDPWTAPQYK